MDSVKAKQFGQRGAVLIPYYIDKAGKMSKTALYLLIALIILVIISAAVLVGNVVYDNYQIQKVKVLDDIISEKARILKAKQEHS